MPNPRKHRKTVLIISDLFVFGGYYENSKFHNTFIRYTEKTKTWFGFLVCGGKNKSGIFVDTVYKLDGPDPEFCCLKYTCMPNKLYFSKTAVVNSDLFVFGGFS